MKRASAAAPPRSGCAPGAGTADGAGVAAGASGVAAAPLPAADRTSALVILPPRAVPFTRSRSIPSWSATRRATGETLAGVDAAGGAVGAAAADSAGAASVGADAAGVWGAVAAAAAPGAPAVIRAMTWPTVTVAPSSTRISEIVPDAGAGNSMSTLSVEISTTVSPSLTVSPTSTDHSRIVPSVTDSPPVGVTMSTVLAVSGAPTSASVEAAAAASSAVVGGDSPDTGVAEAPLV